MERRYEDEGPLDRVGRKQRDHIALSATVSGKVSSECLALNQQVGGGEFDTCIGIDLDNNIADLETII